MPAPLTTAELIDLAQQSGVLDAAAFDRLRAEPDGLPDEAPAAAARMVRAGAITAFQAKLLLAGKHRGFKLGPYVIRDQLGQGGMGVVYLAEHERLRRRVAVKVLNPGDQNRRLAVERFLREARAAAALDHPNIVHIFDVAQQENVHYLVMEYVEGQTLDRVILGGPLAVGRAVDAIAQAATGLQHAHEKGFVHRDVKPGNLMLARDGTVKVMDMGLARSTDAESGDNVTERFDQGASVGTADFVAPEQAMNDPALDGRADVYSLGATFYTLVTGRPPFDGTTTQKLVKHQVEAPPSVLRVDPTFPPGLDAVIRAMMAKSPEERYQSAAEVVAALEPWAPRSGKLLAGVAATAASGIRGGDSTIRAASLSGMQTPAPGGHTGRFAGPGSDVLRTTLPAAPAPGRRNGRVLAAAAALAAAATVVALYAAFAPAPAKPTAPEEPPAVAGAPPTAPTVPPPVVAPPEPPAAPTVTPVADAEPRGPRTFFRMALAGVPPFRVVGHFDGPAGARGKERAWVATAKSGSLPAGWGARAWRDDSDVEISGDVAEGVPSLALRTLSGSPSAVLETPEVALPNGPGKLAVEYKLDGTVNGQIRLLRAKPGPPREVGLGPLKPTGGAWETAELDVDPAGAAAGTFRVSNDAADGTLRVRGMALTEAEPDAEVAIYRMPRLVPWVKLPAALVAGADASAVDGPDGPVLNLLPAGPRAATAATAAFAVPDRQCRVTVVYRTPPKGPGARLRFRPSTSGVEGWEVTPLPPTGGSWGSVAALVDPRGATGGSFELIAPGGDGAGLQVSEWTVTRPASTAAPTKRPESVIYRWSAETLPSFRYAVEFRRVTAGDGKVFPRGIIGNTFRQGGAAEFTTDAAPGEPRAARFVNLSEPPSGQLTFDFERELGVKLVPGKSYKVRVEYKTTGRGRGTLLVQETGAFRTMASADLPAATKDWRKGELLFRRVPDAVLRAAVYNTALGADHAVAIRAFEVVEVK